jgi:hypothetical protein
MMVPGIALIPQKSRLSQAPVLAPIPASLAVLSAGVLPQATSATGRIATAFSCISLGERGDRPVQLLGKRSRKAARKDLAEGAVIPDRAGPAAVEPLP